jgi:hypothetical protein
MFKIVFLCLFDVRIKMKHDLLTDIYLHVDVVMEQLKELMSDVGIQIVFIQNEY